MARIALAALACLLLAGPPASAQGVRLEFHDGYVSLSAQNATVREILAEWSRLGQTKVVNADRVPGGPLTLELQRVPEKRALEIVLRAASGYVVSGREADVAGASAFERILVMPPSTAARVAPAPPMPAPGAFPGVPPPQPVDPNAEPLTDDEGQPVMPQPGFVPDYDDPEPPPPQGAPAFAPGPRGGVDPSVPPPDVEPAPEAVPAEPGPQPLNPGTLTSPRPGVLPVPEQRQQPQ